jgi:hypothetical protein
MKKLFFFLISCHLLFFLSCRSTSNHAGSTSKIDKTAASLNFELANARYQDKHYGVHNNNEKYEQFWTIQLSGPSKQTANARLIIDNYDIACPEIATPKGVVLGSDTELYTLEFVVHYPLADHYPNFISNSKHPVLIIQKNEQELTMTLDSVYVIQPIYYPRTNH